MEVLKLIYLWMHIEPELNTWPKWQSFYFFANAVKRWEPTLHIHQKSFIILLLCHFKINMLIIETKIINILIKARFITSEHSCYFYQDWNTYFLSEYIYQNIVWMSKLQNTPHLPKTVLERDFWGLLWQIFKKLWVSF